MASKPTKKRTSGPITIAIYEGMVKIEERHYVDARKALLAPWNRWPRWIENALRKIEREAAKR